MRRVKVAGALAVLGLVAACGANDDDGTTGALVDELHGLAESSCRALGDCQGKDSAWIEGCVQEEDRQIAEAEGYGCLDIMAAWFRCLADNSVCTPDKDYTDQGACADQEERGEDCRKGRL